jgi:hypothetical protein
LDGVFRMRDRETGTIWTHLDGKAIAGPLEGQRLNMIPIPQTTWGQWKADYAETLVLSPDTPFQDRYVRPVRIGVFNPNEAVYGDDRLPSNALIVGIEVEGVFKGYPLDELESAGGVVNDSVAGRPIVVFYDSDAQTGVAYLREIDGQTMEFYNVGKDKYEVRDRQTDSCCGMFMDAQSRAPTGKPGSNSCRRSYPSGTAGPPTTQKPSYIERSRSAPAGLAAHYSASFLEGKP